jgi:Methyltransferase domain
MWLWIKKWIKRLFFFGWRYQCYACGSRLREWQWQGEDSDLHTTTKMVGSGRRRCLCPICHSIDRERLLLHFLSSEIAHQHWRELRVLHIAPEQEVEKRIHQYGPLQYVKGDYFASGYSYNEAVQMDIQHMKWPDDSFDLIICSHVLEHVADDHQALKEMRRVLSPKGKALIMVPMAKDLMTSLEGSLDDDDEIRRSKFGQSDHLRLYGRDFLNRIEAVGFKVHEWQANDGSIKWQWNQDESIFVAQRSED